MISYAYLLNRVLFYQYSVYTEIDSRDFVTNLSRKPENV